MNQKTILLVEDSTGDIRLMKEGFKKQQLESELKVVKDGEEAIDYLENDKIQNPNLIILDLDLPKLSGHDVLEAIDNKPEIKKIPVIVLTMSDMDADIEKSYRLGANCCLKKPLDFENFERVIEMIDKFWCQMVELPK